MRLLAGLFALVCAACSSAVAAPTVRRVIATPIPTASPAPTPRVAGPPVLDNPGGGITWNPSRDAGPWTTDGTISLPTLGVSAPIVRVGVDLTGEMVTPRNASQVAWLDQGPFPGHTSNGVLAGHKNYSGRTGTFDRLHNLRDGDPIVVSMDGRTWTFHVIWVGLYDPDTAPVQQLMGRTTVPTITLITCGGAFDRRTRHYQSRMIARAVARPAS